MQMSRFYAHSCFDAPLLCLTASPFVFFSTRGFRTVSCLAGVVDTSTECPEYRRVLQDPDYKISFLGIIFMCRYYLLLIYSNYARCTRMFRHFYNVGAYFAKIHDRNCGNYSLVSIVKDAPADYRVLRIIFILLYLLYYDILQSGLFSPAEERR